MRRRGFTIIELLAVIGILSILMTIVTTAAVGALQNSRYKRTEAMKAAFQAAIATYRAADPSGRWPGALETKAQSATSGWLSEDAAQNVFRIVVQRSTGESGALLPLIDPSALFVAPNGAKDGRTSGLSFNEARQGTEKRQKLAVARMLFGHPGKASGRFHRFNVYYNAATDSAVVLDCCQECQDPDGPRCKDGRSCSCHE